MSGINYNILLLIFDAASRITIIFTFHFLVLVLSQMVGNPAFYQQIIRRQQGAVQLSLCIQTTTIKELLTTNPRHHHFHPEYNPQLVELVATAVLE